MNNRFLLIPLVLFVFSCDQKASIKDSPPISDIDGFKSYKVDIKAPKVKITDLIENIELVRLEETDESLLSTIRQVFLHQGMIIVNTMRDNDIFFFDQNGNFLHKINRTGDGPEEYKSISEVWLNKDGISIYTRWVGTIKNYGLKGDFINSSQLPTFMGQMGHLTGFKNSYVLETNFSILDDSSRHKWIVLDKDLKPIQKHLPFEPMVSNESHPFYSTSTPIASYNDALLIFRSHSDTIYQLSDSKIKPIIHFDYGDNWFWKGQSHITQDGFVKIEADAVPRAWEMTANVGDKQVYTKALMGLSHWEHFLIDRQSGRTNRLDFRKDAKTEYELSPLLWQGDQLLCAIASTEVAEFTNQLGEENVQYKQGTSMDIIESSENPVLIWITFKNND